MSKEGYRSVSIDGETDEMLEQIASKVEKDTGIKMTLHQTIKYLAKRQLKVTAK